MAEIWPIRCGMLRFTVERVGRLEPEGAPAPAAAAATVWGSARPSASSSLSDSSRMMIGLPAAGFLFGRGAGAAGGTEAAAGFFLYVSMLFLVPATRFGPAATYVPAGVGT